MSVFTQISALSSELHSILCYCCSVISFAVSLWVLTENKNNRFPTWHIYNGLGAFATGQLTRWLVWRQLHNFSKYSRICKYGKCGQHMYIRIHIHTYIHWCAYPYPFMQFFFLHLNNLLQLINMNQIFFSLNKFLLFILSILINFTKKYIKKIKKKMFAFAL